MPILSCSLAQTCFEVQEYNLAATLTSGQVFRWQSRGDDWESVIAGHWVRLRGTRNGIVAMTVEPADDWSWLGKYLQVEHDLGQILATFPKDETISEATRFCRGLRLLLQDPWECLASFILSSSKQIVQIQQIVLALCERFGQPVQVPPGHPPHFSFPTAERLAECSESELRSCKMGFRAPYLKQTAAMIAGAEVKLATLPAMSLERAREELLKLPGVGRKIADCVLLFAYGFQKAFPIDVWVAKALRELYFRRRQVPQKRLQRFSEEYFGPFGGYAQQYLFHYIRNQEKRATVQRLAPKHRAAANVP